jgi:hypothetical protein
MPPFPAPPTLYGRCCTGAARFLNGDEDDPERVLMRQIKDAIANYARLGANRPAPYLEAIADQLDAPLELGEQSLYFTEEKLEFFLEDFGTCRGTLVAT